MNHWATKVDSSHTITKVKRLSDNEVFTVGDKICPPLYEITKFVISDGKILVYNQHGNWYFLSQIAKLNPIPLFTTEDGVDIFEGDEYFSIDTMGEWEIYQWTKASEIKNKDWLSYNKIFSTEEAAKTFVLMNKPCLSLIEIDSIYVGDKPYDFCNNLFELARKKINNNNK